MYCAVVKESSPSGGFIHDGFFRFRWNTVNFDQLFEEIQDIYPQLMERQTQIIVVGTEKISIIPRLMICYSLLIFNQLVEANGDKVIGRPYKEEKLKDFANWLCKNYSDGERVKMYIETSAARMKTEHVRFASESGVNPVNEFDLLHLI